MKKWKIAIVLVVLSLLLAACGSNRRNAAKGTNENAASEQAGKNDKAGEEQDANYPMTVSPTISTTETEDAGKVAFEDVTFETKPEKIVVFDYGFLDTLDALGVEGVVGLPKDSTLPEQLSDYADDKYTSVGTLKEPLLEDIAELQPDVIFISNRLAPYYKQLKEITPNVVFVGTSQDDYWDTFLASVDIAAKCLIKKMKRKNILRKSILL